MSAVNLLNYESHRDFLKDYYQYKQSQNSNFNFTVWSRKLNLSNVASLTRVVNGDRIPGEKLLEDFFRYFEFSNVEREYFTTLVRLAKETDYLVRSSLVTRLHHLKEHGSRQWGASSADPLIILKARMLLLWGEADVLRYNKVLDEFGLENILSYGGGRSTVCLKVAYVHESKMGTYYEFNFASYVKRKGMPLSTTEMYFDKLYCSNSEAADFWRSWGSPFEKQGVRATVDPIASPKSAVVSEADREALVLKFGRKDTLEAEQPMDMHAYNALLGSKYSFKMHLNSTAKFREFDPAIDECRWDSTTELGRFLDAIQFKPTFWTYHGNFQADIFAPVPR